MFKIFILLACFLFYFCQFPTSTDYTLSNKIAFVADSNIYMMDLTTKNLKKLTNENARYDDLVLSPNRDKFIFTSDAKDRKKGIPFKNYNLISLDLYSFEKENLTAEIDLSIFEPKFSSSGRSIFFLAERSALCHRVYKIDSDGNNFKLITDIDECVLDYAILNDNLIAYSEGFWEEKLLLLNINNRNVINLTPNLHGEIWSISADIMNKDIYFCHNSYLGKGNAFYKINIVDFNPEILIDYNYESDSYFEKILSDYNKIIILYRFHQFDGYRIGIFNPKTKKIFDLAENCSKDYSFSMDKKTIIYKGNNSNEIFTLNTETYKIESIKTKFSYIRSPVFLY